MDQKIELIQEENGSGRWHWIILKYNGKTKTWHNVGCGMEESYVKASETAKKEYDSL